MTRIVFDTARALSVYTRDQPTQRVAPTTPSDFPQSMGTDNPFSKEQRERQILQQFIPFDDEMNEVLFRDREIQPDAVYTFSQQACLVYSQSAQISQRARQDYVVNCLI